MKHELLSPTKGDLIMLIKRREETDVNGAADKLDLSKSAIRQHLSELARDGLVDSRLNRENVGRPRKMYHLTETAQTLFENRESTTLINLLRFLIDSGESELVAEFFSINCDERLGVWRRQLADIPKDDKISALEQLLQEFGYLPEFSYDDEGRLVIEFFHYPYPNLASLQRQPCRCEKQILEELSGTSLEQASCFQDGADYCRFLESFSDSASDGPAPSD